MTELNIPREAVEAGLDAFNRQFAFGCTAEMAETILKGAAPLIVAAELERLIAVAVEYGKNCPCPGIDEPGVNCTNRFHFEAARVIKRVRIRLDELRAQS